MPSIWKIVENGSFDNDTANAGTRSQTAEFLSALFQ
jgi:hypothetical protein